MPGAQIGFVHRPVRKSCYRRGIVRHGSPEVSQETVFVIHGFVFGVVGPPEQDR
jgi:hypothetical protein